MKLIYKLFSFALLSGAAATTYLLIPSAPVEVIESVPEPLPERGKSGVSWKKSFMDQGYVPVSMTDAFEDFSNILEVFREVKGIPEGQERGKLRELCNSFENKDELDPSEIEDAKRWCTNPKEVSDILLKRGRKMLYRMENGMQTWDTQKLRPLAKQYQKNQDENLKMATSWDNSDLLNMTDRDLDGDLEVFKGACTNALAVKSFENNLEQKIKRAEQWCTEPA